MATITIAVSDADLQRLRDRAAKVGFDDPAAFVQSLVADELDPDITLADAAAPEHLKVRSRERLVALLREGLASPSREMTQADFDQMHADIAARGQQSKAG